MGLPQYVCEKELLLKVPALLQSQGFQAAIRPAGDILITKGFGVLFLRPFVEDGRDGFGVSARYSHNVGVSARGEYGRYHKESEVNTEFRTNMNLSLSKLPSFFAAYYQQRVPYAKYDIRGASLGSSYQFWKLAFSATGSYSNTVFWMDDVKRRSISGSTSVRYEVAANTDLRTEFFQFGSYESGDKSRVKRHVAAGIQRRVAEDHLFGMYLKAVELSDRKDTENDYFETVPQLKYGYSF